MKPCCGTVPTMKIGTQQFHLHGQLFDVQCMSILHLQMKIVVFKMSGQIESNLELSLNMSVLTALAMQIPGLSQTQILDKFIRRLKSKTRIEVELRDPETLEEAYRLADRFGRIVYSAKSTTFLTQHYNRYS